MGCVRSYFSKVKRKEKARSSGWGGVGEGIGGLFKGFYKGLLMD